MRRDEPRVGGQARGVIPFPKRARTADLPLLYLPPPSRFPPVPRPVPLLLARGAGAFGAKAAEETKPWREVFPEFERTEWMPEFTSTENGVFRAMTEKSDGRTDTKYSRLWLNDWLDDDTIDDYLELVRVRSTRLLAAGVWGLPRLHFMLTSFYSVLTSGGRYNYENVRRWTTHGSRKVNLFDPDLVFFPCNLRRCHWVLCVAKMREMKLEYFDSTGESGMRVMKHILSYLDDESKDKRNGRDIMRWKWELVDHRGNAPQQLNSVDCGVFVCALASRICLGSPAPLDLMQEQMPYFRKRIFVDLILGAAQPWPALE